MPPHRDTPGMPDEESPRDIGHVEKEEPRFDQLSQLRAFDRQQHIQKSLEAGLSREEAERHADDDMKDRDDSVE